MTTKSLLPAALLAVALSTTSFAADLVQPSEPVFAPAEAPGWTGGYVGVGLGGTFQDDRSGRVRFDTDLDGVPDELTDIVPGGPTGNAFAPGFCDGRARGNTPAAGCSSDDSAFTGSVVAGYDYQMGAIVIGGLAEVAFVDIEDYATAFSVTPTFYTFKRELDFTVAARARVGYAADSFLIYGTGGVVFGDSDTSFDTGNGVNTFTLDEDNNDVGYQVGVGGEYKITQNISLSLEYLYTSFGEDDSTVRVGPGARPGVTFSARTPAGTDLSIADDVFDYHTVQVGMKYRF